LFIATFEADATDDSRLNESPPSSVELVILAYFWDELLSTCSVSDLAFGLANSPIFKMGPSLDETS